MADLASTRIFGKLTVIHNVVLKADAEITGDVTAASFAGDGSGLTNIPGVAGWEYYGGAATLSTARTYRILADTSTGAWTLTLPSTPSEGHSIDIIDYAHTWDVNNLTVAGNGNTINGDTTLVCDVLAKSVILVFWSGEWKMSF